MANRNRNEPGVPEGFSISVFTPNEYLGEVSCNASAEARILYALGARIDYFYVFVKIVFLTNPECVKLPQYYTSDQMNTLESNYAESFWCYKR